MKLNNLIIELEFIQLIDNSVFMIYREDCLFDNVQSAFEFNKKLLQHFKAKKIIFNFHGTHIEINKHTNINDVVNSYDFQNQIQNKIYINEFFKKRIDNMNEHNVKQIFYECGKELIELNLIIKSQNVYPNSYLEKELVNKFYHLYKINHADNKYSLYPPLPIEKVKIKKQTK